jgi:hypothetical protein
MPLNSSLFCPLPTREELLRRIQFYEERNGDLSSYMWYLLPLVAKFGECVYQVAAQSLTCSGLAVTADELRDLGIEMQTQDGQKKYARHRALHIGAMLTSYKPSGEI